MDDPTGRYDPTPDPKPAGRRTLPLLIAGGGAALLLVVVLGLWLFAGGDDTTSQTETDGEGGLQGGLQIEVAQTEVGNIDPNRPLRCFVEGRFVGELTVSACAQRNGVPTGQIDVGVDDTGALAAVVSTAPPPPPIDSLAPTPDLPPPPVVATLPDIPLPAPSGPTGECLRFAGGEWRGLGEALPLETCVQVLFAGRCPRPGDAHYGRWKGQSLRLVQGGVEIAGGGGYRPLMSQDPQTCMFP